MNDLQLKIVGIHVVSRIYQALNDPHAHSLLLKNKYHKTKRSIDFRMWQAFILQ